MIRLGFTGTQRGMTPAQYESFRRFILAMEHDPDEFHHGDCVGADEEAHGIMEQYVRGCLLVAHPALLVDDSKCARTLNHEVREPAPPLTRNKRIVAASDMIVATPKEHTEVRRSGTWSTVRYAKKAGVPVHICWPDGTWKTFVPETLFG